MFTCMQDKYVIVMLCLLYARQVCYCNAMFTIMYVIVMLCLCMQDKYVIVMLCLLVCKTSMLL